MIDDVDETTSENNITINVINRFRASPHQIDQNDYHFHELMIQDNTATPHESVLTCARFRSAITVLLSNSSLPSASVNASATTLSIHCQTSKKITRAGAVEGYARILIQFHRRRSGGLQYLYLDLKGEALNSVERMIVYGVQGYVPNVDPQVSDTLYVLEDGRTELQTDLDLNGHRLMNNGQGGFCFDSGQITMHDVLNTNDKIVVGSAGGGLETGEGRLKT